MGAMTKKEIEAVLDRVRTWPIERQEDAARTLIRMEALGREVYVLSDDERADVEEALEEVARGEVASDGQVAAAFSRFKQ